MTHYRLVDSQQTVIGPDGRPIPIRPQSYQVFSYLLSRENVVVSKHELFSEIWGSVVVTDDSLTQCISDIRKLLGPEHRRLLQTIPKKGYRLLSGTDANSPPMIARIAIVSPPGDQHSVEGAARTGETEIFASSGLDKTSDEVPVAKERPEVWPQRKIFLIPSVNRFSKSYLLRVASGLAIVLTLLFGVYLLSNSATKIDTKNNTVSGSGPSMIVYPLKTINEQGTDYFSEGMSADIILALNRLSNLRVLPFRTVQDYQSNPQYMQSIVDEFDPQYALSGSVWKHSDRVRLNIELTNATNGNLLWSQRYDEVLGDVFKLQQTIARSVATALSVNLVAIETQRAFKNPTESMEAYDLVLTGRSKLRLRNRKDNMAARAMFDAAIALDADYAEAYVGLGVTYIEEAMFGYSEWPHDALATALDLAQLAVKLDYTNAEVIGFLALVYFRHDKFELANIEVERALSLNPNNPDLYILKGLLLSRKGLLSEAIEHLEYARRFDPEIRSGWTELGGLYYLNGEVEKSILIFERGLSLISHIAYVHVMLAAAYAEIGDMEQARLSASRVLKIVPFFDSQEFSRYSLFSTHEQRTRLLESLAKAGLD